MLAVGVHGDHRLVAARQAVANARLHTAPSAHRQHRLEYMGALSAGDGTGVVAAVVVDDQHIVPTSSVQVLQQRANGGRFVARWNDDQHIFVVLLVTGVVGLGRGQ